MASQISGNAGGASASGAFVQAVGQNALNTVVSGCDASGNFILPRLIAGTYVLSASTSGLAGAYAKLTYRTAVSVTVDGINNVANVTIPAPVA